MAVLVDITKCIGCESCSVACKLWNKLPYGKKKSRKQKEEKDLDDDTWTVIQRKRVEAPSGKGYTRFVKKQCMHCLEPSCASACFSKALRVDPETHAVVYIPELCVGCRYCMIACPFEIPRYQWDEPLPLVTKCQLCASRLKAGDAPACVSASFAAARIARVVIVAPVTMSTASVWPSTIACGTVSTGVFSMP